MLVFIGFLVGILNTAGYVRRKSGGKGGTSPNQSPAGDLNDQVFSSGAIHSFSHPCMPVFGNHPRLVELMEEIVQVMRCLEDDIASPSAITAARAPFRDVCFTMECDTTFAAVTGSGVDLYFIDEHGGIIAAGLK
jgi:hypothetical protein